MRESLGLNISNNFIRYAKIQDIGNKTIIKSLGVKVYDGEPKTIINQIIEETDSYKSIISTNITEEQYYYSKLYTNKKIKEKDIKLEFSEFCKENDICNEEIIGRYIFQKYNNKSKAIYIYNYTNTLFNIYKKFEKPKSVERITPISISLTNLIPNKSNKNIVIINLEEVISITTLINGQIDGIAKMDYEMYEIFEKLHNKEPDFLKVYDSIKNTTIYKNITNEDDKNNDERLKLIIPLLYKINELLQKVKKKFDKIDEIYLTGFGANINNIEYYFNQLFSDTTVKILNPWFIKEENAKQFTEYNAAISLAIEGLSYNNDLNFCDKEFENRIFTNKNTKKTNPTNKKTNAIVDIITILVIFIIYLIGNNILNKQISKKKENIDKISNYTLVQTEKAEEDKKKIAEIITEYATAKSNNVTNNKKTKINNLLNQIYNTIPKNVKIIEIKNSNKSEESQTEAKEESKFLLIVETEESSSIDKFIKELENSNIVKKANKLNINLNNNQYAIEVELK